ncbi:hypothetical protein DB30_07912 [Enhygromyxa salina]|uniref:Glycine zipper domain-containing protein n=1 Tax=Enhygromyxa salina TaxID=215803 RepID=A0A0C2CQX4_9BACT|nr:hypothetical protein [Enhygromyxa salina]KIG13581.1 hypothetical protein DB30_07912 [Enhygromyxa salina]
MGVRALAMSAGDMSVFVMQEVTQIMEDQRNNQARAIKVGINRLRADGHVSRPEAKDLEAIARCVLRSTRKNADIPKAAAELREFYKAMAMSSKTSPVALAIASAASASLTNLQMSKLPMPKGAAAGAVIPGNAGVGAVVGGVIGGVIGGIAGGGLGAGLGASIGAAAGAAIGYCNEQGV